MLRFLRKFPQIVKDLFRLVQDTVSAAFLVENRHEVSLIGAAAFISVSKGTDVLLFHAREVLVQLGVKIFSVTLPERYAHSKAQNFSWNDYFTTFIMINDTKKLSLPVGILSIRQPFATGDNVEFAAVVLSVIPVLLVFIIGQKWIVKSMTHVGVKG